MAQQATPGSAGEQLWKHRQEVRDVARRVLGDATSAEDVSQEALLRALSNAATLDEKRRGAWLTVVGRRLAIDELRQRQRTESRAEPIERVAPGGDAAELAEHREFLTQAWEAVGRLNPRQQRLLLGQVVAGLSLDQLAAEERTTVASVRSVLARARETVRACLHGNGWLAAGTAHRALSTAQDSLNRLLAKLEHIAPRVQQLPRETGDALGAAIAAMALLLTPSGAADRPPAPSSSDVSGMASPSTDGALTDRRSPDNRLLSTLPHEQQLLLRDLMRSPAEAGEQERHQVIPFTPTDGELVQFAVAPDQQTILANGGWAETEESAAGQSTVREWEPFLYRSDDGGRHWKQVRRSGFLPGRVLFAPAWPADDRIFVIAEDCVLLSVNGGRTFNCVKPTTPDVEPGPTPHVPEDAEELDSTDGPDPNTVIRSTQRPPAVALRPAVLSPRFSDGDERIYLGEPAEVFDVKLGVAAPLLSVPPWARSRGIAAASDYATSSAVLVGASVTQPGLGERGALFRCAERRCDKLHVFDGISEPPGVFTTPAEPGLVYAWTTYAAYRSADGGRTWERQVVGPVLDLVEVGGRLVFLSLSGVPVSDDDGKTWRQLRVLYSISAVAPIGRNGLLLAAGPGMACSSDRGDTWLPACA